MTAKGRGTAGLARPGEGRDARLRLRILATSDLHANLLPWDYHSNQTAPQRGLSALASLIATARAEQPQNLLFDNGDFLHGTALGDFMAEAPVPSRPRGGQTHPMIAAMNHLRYDAAALGNHEFSHGLGFLRRSLARANFPLICSNLYFKPSRAAPLSLPHAMLRKRLLDDHGQTHSLVIGVLGFLPPQTMIWERRYLKSRASVDDIVGSARALIPVLRQRGADLIIALSHSGIGEGTSTPGAENASSALAELAGIDVVIAGHTHLLFPADGIQTLHGKPAVMPGFFGSHLGVIDLALQRARKGWRVASHQTALRPISRRDPQTGRVAALVAEDPAIRALAAPAHAALLARGEAVIAESPIPLHSFFALLTETPALRLVAEAQARRLALALQGGPHAGLPVLSAVAPFKAGGRGGPENYTDIPAGPLRLRHLGDLYLHPNSLVGLRVTGADLLLWLERAVSLFHQIRPGQQDAPLIDATHPSFNFDSIHGLTWQIDLTQPPRFDAAGRLANPDAWRIVGLAHQGHAVTADQVFALATNNYRSAGGSGFAGALPSQVIHDGGEDCRAVVEAHLRAGARPAPIHQPPWRFCAIANTTALFETAPAAAGHLADVPHLRLHPLETLATGFRRFRLLL